MSHKFAGKVALVTGGNSGIGLAAALAFAKEGARVVFTGRDQSTLDKAAAQLGENVIAVRSDSGSVADGIKLTALLQGRGVMLDAVFINAGVAKLASFEAVGEEMWDATFNTNLKGPYFLIKALLPRLNPGAAIVLNGSINAHIGMPNTSVYAASKAALIAFVKSAAKEVAQHRVRFLDALQRQPARARRHAGVALADDQPLALVVDDDGRGGGAGALEALHVAHVDPLHLQAGADGVARSVIAGAAPQLGLAAEPGNGDRRVGSHAAAGLDMLERAHLRRLRRKRLNPINAVERGMSHADDALRRWHSSVRA